MVVLQLPNRLPALSGRSETCPASQPVSCSAIDPKLPNNFCCTPSTECLSLDASSSALCCPQGQDCSNIATINCDISLQNEPPVFTTLLNGTLPTCGSQCCPFGYTCDNINEKSVCVLVKERAITTASTSTTISSLTSITPAVSTGSATLSTSNGGSRTSGAIPPGILAAIAIAGVVAGILAILTILWFLKKRRSKATEQRQPLEKADELETQQAEFDRRNEKQELPAHSVGMSKERYELEVNARRSMVMTSAELSKRKFRTRRSQIEPAEVE